MVKFIPLVLALIILAVAISWPRSELTSKAFLNRVLASNGKFDPAATKAVWFNKDVPLPTQQLAQLLEQPAPTQVLGENNEEKWVEVDLSAQRLYAHQGNSIIYTFPISSGLPWMPTVTGEYRIWAKVRSQRMTGGSVENGTYFDLPNVPFVQYFYQGYSLHGTYWHNDFGKPRSHGCVNMRIDDAQVMYYWTSPSLGADEYTRYHINPQEATKVVVHGTTPTQIN